MNINPGQLIVWLIIGVLAGFLAGQVFRRRGFGLLGNLVIGLIGALVGGALFRALRIDLKLPKLTFSADDLAAAFVGAVILLAVVRFIQRR